MATTNIQTQCFICKKQVRTYHCDGCSNEFCRIDLTKHFQEHNEQLDQIEYNYDQFRQIIIDQKQNTNNFLLIKQIDQWEQNSIEKIKQTANQCKQIINNYTNLFLNDIEKNLNNLAKQIKQIRNENEFNEIDLNQLNNKLNKLKEELNNPTNLSVKQKSTSFINLIFVKFPQQLFIPNLNIDQTWIQNGRTKAGGHGSGNQLNQLSNPYGVYIDDDQTIYVADTDNDCIVKLKNGTTDVQIVAGGNEMGDRNDQLNGPTNVIIDKRNDCLIICDQGNRRVVRWPRENGQSGETIISNVDCWDLIMDNDGYLYVSDHKRHEVRRWKIGETEGTIVAGGNGKGNRLDQLNGPYYIFVDQDHSVYVSDYNNHRVMKWLKDAKEGVVVAGGQGEGNGLRQVVYPNGLIIDQFGNVYVADEGNHRVIRWLKGAEEGTIVVGGNGQGEKPNQFFDPMDLSFDQQNNLYVVDFNNHRVQKFDVNLN